MRPRTNPIAARVPSAVDATVTTIATLKLSSAASYQRSEVKKRVYQRTDQVCGGNCRNGVPLKEATTITRIGATGTRSRGRRTAIGARAAAGLVSSRGPAGAGQ